MKNLQKLAKSDEAVVNVELRRDTTEETSGKQSAELDARALDLLEVKALFNNVELRYSVTSSSNTLLRTELRVAV